jgi:dipeptidyl aminopeptidase/acylaminoacyl peptidase
MTIRRLLLPVVLPALIAGGIYARWPGPGGSVAVASGLKAQAQDTRGPRPMTLLDVVAVPRITDAQLSPDGRSVSYNLGRADWRANRPVTHVWKQPVAGGPPVQLTNGQAESSARWSPDSTTLLYMSGGQIYLVPADGGAPRQLTHHATPVQASPSPITMPTWTPDGSAIYFVASDTRADAQRGVTNNNVTVFGQTDFTQQHIWKVSVTTGAEQKVTDGDWSVLAFRLSNDGRQFAVLRAPTPLAIDHYRSDVWVMTVDGGNARALTTNGLYELDAELSPDNSQVWFLADANEKLEPYNGQTLFVVPATGGRPQMLLPGFGHSIDSAEWAPDGKSILAVVNLGLHQEIYRIDVATRTARALTEGRHAILGMSLVAPANRLIFQIDEPTRIGDGWTLPVDGGTPTKVTGVYDSLATDFTLPRQEKVTWKGADGVTIEGLLFYPVGYQEGTRYPLVVQLHGGPSDSDKFGFGPGVIFNYVPVLAAKGYAVLRPNYRGSSGYGSAFLRDIIGHYFNNMHLDVMAGVDALVKQGIADPDRLAVTGASAGGHLVNKLITFTTRFKAASSTAGVANWISMMAQTDAVTRRTFWMGGTPWQKDAPTGLLWNNSPIKDVAKVKTPTLFIAGARDQRVPKEQAFEMYRGLDSNGVPTKLIIGDNEGHQWQEIRSQFFKANTELEWFEKYVMNRSYRPEVAPVDAPAAR